MEANTSFPRTSRTSTSSSRPRRRKLLRSRGQVLLGGNPHGNYCAYHGDIPVAQWVIIYANDPYLARSGCDSGEEHPSGLSSEATIAGGLAHEHSESVTDPELNAWYDARGKEVADKCAHLQGSE